MKTLREIVTWFIIGGLVGTAGGLAVNIIRDLRKIDAMGKQLHELQLDGGTP